MNNNTIIFCSIMAFCLIMAAFITIGAAGAACTPAQISVPGKAVPAQPDVTRLEPGQPVFKQLVSGHKPVQTTPAQTRSGKAVPARQQTGGSAAPIAVLDVNDMITSGTASYLARKIESLTTGETPVQAVIVNLNTPGGLVDATLDILAAFAESPVPVIAYVSPSGAIAASAGSFLLVGAHLAAMAPGTTVGAAMPVEVSPTGERKAADEKTISFLAGHMESVASLRGRPAEIASSFVTENLTLDSGEALQSGIIDYEAATLTALLKQVNGREVELQEKTITINTEGAGLITVPMSFSENLQSQISDPQVAFILLAAGAIALYLGFSMPGTVILEILGALFLVLAIYGMGFFSTSTTGIVLIALGLALLAAELFTSTAGVFAVSGAASIILGALLFPQEPLLPGNWYPVFQRTAFGTGIVLALAGIFTASAVLKSRRLRYLKKTPLKEGKVVKELNPVGLVKVEGELWRARAIDNTQLPEGSPVMVIDRQGLTLLVEAKKLESKQPN